MTQQTWRGKTFKQLVSEAKSQIEEIPQETLKQWMAEGKELVILDIREPVDYDNGHIQGAINLPRGLLELDIDEVVPNQDKVVVTYCGGGSRSALSAQTLQVMGYNHVYSLIGGYRQWVD
jgi:rhodanese-related sulfurtransferase